MFIKTTEGFGRQKKDITIITDWVEGSTVLLNEEVSKSDIIDIFNEENIFSEKDAAIIFVSDVWTEFKRRQNEFRNKNLFQMDNNKITSRKKWRDISAYSFCLAISLVSYYHKEDFIERNSQEIGRLFELLTKESLKTLFPNWKLYHTGWSSNTRTPFEDLLNDIEKEFNVVRFPNYKNYLKGREKDASLDIILSRPFNDENCCIPLYLFQCASGQNWVNKRKEPDTSRWNKFIEFNSPLSRAIAIPYSLTREEYNFNAPIVEGLLFDRYRLLAAYEVKYSWVSKELRNELNNITCSIINTIEKYQ